MVSLLHRLLLGLPWAGWLTRAGFLKSDDDYIYLKTWSVERLSFASQPRSRVVNKLSRFPALSQSFLKLKLDHNKICLNAKQTYQPYVHSFVLDLISLVLGDPWHHVQNVSLTSTIQKRIYKLNALKKLYCSWVALSRLFFEFSGIFYRSINPVSNVSHK